MGRNRQIAQSRPWLVIQSLVAVGLSTVITLGAAWPAGSPSKQVTPERYVREVCSSLTKWLDTTSPIDEQVVTTIDELREKKLSPVKTKTKVVALLVKATKSTDTLLAATKAGGSPQVPDGTQLAKEHLQGLTDIRNAYKVAAKAAAKLKTTNGAKLYRDLEAVSAAMANKFDNVGMPLESLQSDATLKQLIDADSRCIDVIDAYKVSFEPTGFKPGDCITLTDFRVVNCTDPHDMEVYVDTTYPGGPEAAFPGNSAVNTFADQTCEAAFVSYVGVPLDQSKYTYTSLYPTSETWSAGDREVVCGVSNENDAPLTRPVMGAAA
jgi:hypothetical protein